jgi:hypothetical protein
MSWREDESGLLLLLLGLLPIQDGEDGYGHGRLQGGLDGMDGMDSMDVHDAAQCNAPAMLMLAMLYPHQAPKVRGAPPTTGSNKRKATEGVLQHL